MDAVVVEDLHKNYRATRALGGVSLSVTEGSIGAVLGPNGAGKTTMVEILEGHRQRTSGRVSVLGLDPGNRKDFAVLRTHLGVVFQATMLEPGVSALDLVHRQATYYRDPLDVDEVLAAVGLTEKRRALVRTLSGGTRRRLDIALALVGRPRILFLDEPTTGLDPVSRRSARELIRKVNGQGTTVLLTSHDLEEVESLADDVVVLAGGQVLTSGTTREIVAASAAGTVVELTLPDGVGAGDLPSGLPSGLTVDDGRVRVVTADPDAVTTILHTWADARGVALEGLAIVPPRLEDAYLSLLDGTSTGTTNDSED
ncbi:ABC transporter ATP-binding protein [Promicromonospora sp. NPDC090134]|uniref:ABC transporter ATP-binding protein n=1 Tax=Promicromonospora sp. NPDC090134 TaxID=3364408 RepID=UPI0037FCBE61